MAANSNHWYSKEGVPVYTTIGKNGKERNTTLRDARKHGHAPSVTTVMKVLSAPGLQVWKDNELIKAAYENRPAEEESVKAYGGRLKAEASKKGESAAKEGTRIHDLIENGEYAYGKLPTGCKHQTAFAEFLDAAIPRYSIVDFERSFFSANGYGGKYDCVVDNNTMVDVKTKDFKEKKDASKMVYAEHAMQLAAYGSAIWDDCWEKRYINIFMSREVPGLAVWYEHKIEDIKAAYKAFMHSLRIWEFRNGYSARTK